MPNVAYLSLGSNINPEVNLKQAIEMLAKETKLVATSSVWETKPIGAANQANYLNAAAIVETELSASQLKQQILKRIEHKLGRRPQKDKYAPRPMDIDIMLFNEQILDIGQRHIPDPEILERAFVAIPLAEIAPHYIHPEKGCSLQSIAKTFDPSEEGMKLRSDVGQTLKIGLTQKEN